MVLVVIPYLASAAQGCELELAVAGWRKHFKEPHHIVIVGDKPKWLGEPIIVFKDPVPPIDAERFAREWMKCDSVVIIPDSPAPEYIPPMDITFIDCPRIDPIPGQYLPHLDHVHKFRKVREMFPNTKGFIYTCDDIYATKDFTMDDVLAPKHPEIGPYFKLYDWHSNAADWWSDRGKTGELCKREGLPVRDWVCHLPVYYEWDKLFDIYDKYDCDHNSYIVENIYFSREFGDEHSEPAKDYRDEVRCSNPGGIRPIGSVTWITNANSGWSKKLEEILRKHLFNTNNYV